MTNMNKDERPNDAVPPAPVRVAKLGGNAVSLDHNTSYSLQDYLTDAGVNLRKGETVTVNGDSETDLTKTVEPGSSIVVTSKVANG